MVILVQVLSCWHTQGARRSGMLSGCSPVFQGGLGELVLRCEMPQPRVLF